MNSQRLLCSQKAGVKNIRIKAFWYTNYIIEVIHSQIDFTLILTIKICLCDAVTAQGHLARDNLQIKFFKLIPEKVHTKNWL